MQIKDSFSHREVVLAEEERMKKVVSLEKDLEEQKKGITKKAETAKWLIFLPLKKKNF